jgi:uncharacterized membrane protein YeaQ/YmgE (transglycosylase-associated protein family)
MTLLEFGLLLVVAAACGALGQALAGYSRGGCLAAIALGFIGALLGTWLSRALGLPELFVIGFEDFAFPIVWAVIGSALFVAGLALLARPRQRGE